MEQCWAWSSQTWVSDTPLVSQPCALVIHSFQSYYFKILYIGSRFTELYLRFTVTAKYIFMRITTKIPFPFSTIQLKFLTQFTYSLHPLSTIAIIFLFFLIRNGFVLSGFYCLCMPKMIGYWYFPLSLTYYKF